MLIVSPNFNENDVNPTEDDDKDDQEPDAPNREAARKSGIQGAYLNKIVKQFHTKDPMYNTRMEQLRNGENWIRRPDPQVAYYNRIISCEAKDSSDLVPREFYEPDVFVFSPCDSFPGLVIKSPCCGETLTLKGWMNFPRRVISIDQNYYILSRRYECSAAECKKNRNRESKNGRTYLAHDAEILNQLPFDVQNSFPAVMSHRSALDKTLMNMIMPLVDSSLNSESIAKTVTELHAKRYWESHLAYLSIWKRIFNDVAADPKLVDRIGAMIHFKASFPKNHPVILKIRDKTDSVANAIRGHLKQVIPPFSLFKDSQCYRGYTPSGMITLYGWH
jgi:hypothetical protein